MRATDGIRSAAPTAQSALEEPRLDDIDAIGAHLDRAGVALQSSDLRPIGRGHAALARRKDAGYANARHHGGRNACAGENAGSGHGARCPERSLDIAPGENGREEGGGNRDDGLRRSKLPAGEVFRQHDDRPVP